MERRFYKLTPAATTLKDTYVVPNGTKLRLSHLGGSEGPLDGNVRIVWDEGGAGEEVIFAATLNGTSLTSKEVTGNGVKKLSIVLENEGVTAQWMGGYWIASD